jgi:CysZ protein
MLDEPAVPDTALAQVRLGFRYFRSGVSTIALNPARWPYVFMPGLITLTVLMVAVGGSVGLFEWLVGSWFEPSPGASGWWSALLWVSRWGLRVLLISVCAVGAYLVAGLIGVPFNDRLSNEIEAEVLGPNDEDVAWAVWFGDLLVSLRHTALGLALWFSCVSVLFLFNLVPGIGSALGTVGSVLVSSLLIARETMDGCMSRRRLGFRHKLRVVWANRWLCFGLGLGAWIGMWVPLMNFVVLPMAVVGGTRLFCWLERVGAVPNAAGDGPLLVERHAG